MFAENRMSAALAIAGVRGAARALSRRLFRLRPASYSLCRERLGGKVGLEIGGPSRIFSRNGYAPIYPHVKRLDNCNFSCETIWGGRIESGEAFQCDPDAEPGRHFILEATALDGIPPNAYDFVLSCHMLEHSANPLKALSEWMRIVKHGGTMVLVVPHRDGSFDHRRPITTLGHLIEDRERDTAEDDLTHLPEILSLHDLDRDPDAGGRAAFERRSRRNLEHRSLHHHVFDTRLVAEMLDLTGWRIESLEPTRPYHIIAVATRPLKGGVFDNKAFLSDDAAFRKRSPFSSDR